MRIQVETLMDQERGLRNTEGYRAILRAIGAGRTLAQEIADFAELKNDEEDGHPVVVWTLEDLYHGAS